MDGDPAGTVTTGAADRVTGDAGRAEAVARGDTGPGGAAAVGAAWPARVPDGGPAATDPWLERMDRLRRVVPLPLLALSTVAAFVFPSAVSQPRLLVPLGLPLIVAAAVVWTVRTVHPVRTGRRGQGQVHFAAHTVIVAVLVWISPAFGVFAYVGFLYAYALGRARLTGFAATALVVAASLTDGYPADPLRDPVHLLAYLLVAGVLTALVLTSASITVRAVEQSRERGVMIAELDRANRRLAASIAENAGLQARLMAQAREAGVVAERQRLAGEIHDTLAQDLAGIVRQLDAADEHRDRTAEWARHVDNARTLARSALTEARRSVRALTPAALERDGLPEALRAVAGSTGRLAGIEVTVDAADVPDGLGPDVEATLFRVAQEALSNVVRHASATRVRVTLTVTGDAVLLDVVDDGAGFDPARPVTGFGLAGMRDRMAGVGGALTVDSAPGCGTAVNASVRR